MRRARDLHRGDPSRRPGLKVADTNEAITAEYATLLRDDVTSTCCSVDRIFLQAYVPKLQSVGGVCRFLYWPKRFGIPVRRKGFFWRWQRRLPSPVDREDTARHGLSFVGWVAGVTCVPTGQKRYRLVTEKSELNESGTEPGTRYPRRPTPLVPSR
jgi:hypothetical protein